MERPYNSLLDEDWVEICDNLWEVLTGTILDIRTPLERLYKVISHLKEKNLLDFRHLSKYTVDEIAIVLNDAGYSWYNQKAKCFEQEINFNLETATYEDMKTIYGIGDKLASMWMAIVHGSNDHPILDTHVLQFLRSKGYKEKDYTSLSNSFKVEAKKLGLTVLELDRQIITNGINKRLGLK